MTTARPRTSEAPSSPRMMSPMLLNGKPMRAALIIEQHLVPSAVEPDVRSTAVVERGDQRLAEAQLIPLRGRRPDVIDSEIASC